MSEYALDQAVRPVATAEPGRFTVELDDAWRALGGAVNGGYATAVCLRALLEVVGSPDPLVVATTFLRSAVPGPAEVFVQEVGRTRRNVTDQARLVQDGIEVVRTQAIAPTSANLARSRFRQGPPCFPTRPTASTPTPIRAWSTCSPEQR